MKVFAYSLLSLCLLASPLFGQQKNKEKQNALIDGKLMYVGHMPERVDSWIVYDLKAWGKYTPTRDPEGVDLVMKAYEPPTRTKYEMRNGIPQPRKIPKMRDHKPILFTVAVTDWVTGRLVWQTDILDRKPKNNRSAPPSSDEAIGARGLSSEQLAQTIVRALRSYVDHLGSQHDTHQGSSPR